MKKKVLILSLAIALCVTLFVIYFAILIHDAVRDDTDEKKNAQLLVERFTASEISGLSFDMSGKEITLRRRNGRWSLTENENLPISETTVKSLVSSIEIITAIRLVNKECDDLSEYKLDSPVYTLKITAHSHEHVFCFGEYSKYYDGYYFCAAGENKVYIVSSDYVKAFSLDIEDLLENDTLPDISKVGNISFTSINGTLLSFDTNNCSEEEERLFEILKSLDIDRFIDYGKEKYETYFLLSPAVIILDGKDTLKLSVGEEDDIIYLLVNDSEMIYTVTCGDKDMGTLLEFINKS